MPIIYKNKDKNNMKTLTFIIILTLLVLIPVFFSIWYMLLERKEKKQNIEALINWNEFIIDNFDNPITKETIKKRNVLLKNMLSKK